MIYYLRFFVIVSVFVLCNSCGELLCGELDSEYKTKVDEVHAKYGDLVRVEHIPCEYRYVNVFILKPNVNDTILNNIHEILYDKTTLKGWTTLDVYGYDGMYLYTHNRLNKTYKKQGD